MIVTQPALLCLSSFWNNLIGRSTAPQVCADAVPKPAAPPAAAVERAASIRSGRLMQSTPTAIAVDASPPERVAPAVHAAEGEERVPVAVPPPDVVVAGSGPLTANERRARAAALRALAFSRTRRFDAAQAAFLDAASLDPLLDLTRVPSFWSLERAAHEAAIAAYVAAGRDGDAAVLRAKVQSVYRPKPLRTRTAPAAT